MIDPREWDSDMSEEEKWADIMDNEPVFSFLIQAKLIELDLYNPDKEGHTGAYISAEGWRVAFQILLAELLSPYMPDLHPKEVLALSQQYALQILADSYRTSSRSSSSSSVRRDGRGRKEMKGDEDESEEE